MNFNNQELESSLDNLFINTIKVLTIDAIQAANSGHPGAPMGLAAAGYTLWTKILKHNPNNPDWFNRDRFVLSCGHASMLLYSLLYITGYDLTLNDIKKFRQIDSKTPGHPEYGCTAGVETTTGPLGQGIANGVGMAISERHLASQFNLPNYNIIDHYTYVICGDGDLMEGVSYESISLAGHLGLDKLICLYDSNEISIEGNINITFTEDIKMRFMACGWDVLVVDRGNDVGDIEKAIISAKNQNNKPSLVILKTHIADGSPNFQDSSDSHGSPLGEDEVKFIKKKLGWNENKNFFVPDEVLNFRKKYKKNCNKNELSWKELYRKYSIKFPDLSSKLVDALSRFLPNDWDSLFPKFKTSDPEIATRSASGLILNTIADTVPSLIGGSADLAPSTKTYIKNSNDFQKESFSGRNIRFGVREFAMGSILSGMFLHGGLRPYGSTFLVFSDYMRSAMRMASLMRLPIIYIFTHDSIAVGEDGPTHQPVEHLAALRTIPRLIVIRPADANETLQAWKVVMSLNSNPVALVLTRQKLPILNINLSVNNVKLGAYIISDCNVIPEILIISTGSEVHVALKVKSILKRKYSKNIRVVSMPSWELFEEQTLSYRESILSPEIKKRVVIEAGISMGWERYVNNFKKGLFISVNDFGFSGPYSDVIEKLEFNVNRIVNKILSFFECKE